MLAGRSLRTAAARPGPSRRAVRATVVTAASASEAFPSGADRGRIDVAPARGSVRLPVLSRVKGRKQC
jgi:hypothetical protein